MATTKEQAAAPEPSTTTTIWTYAEVCRELRVSESTLRRWIETAGFPTPVKIGPRAVRFRAADIREWLSGIYDDAGRRAIREDDDIYASPN